MYKCLFVSIIGALSAGASVPNLFSLFVNCDGATQSSSVDDTLRCDQGGLTASASGNLGTLQVVTFMGSGASGRVEAQASINGLFSMSIDNQSVAFWDPCLTVSNTGTGVGFASMTYGPTTLGEPCDFAHAIRVNPAGRVVFENVGSAYANAGEIVLVHTHDHFYDALGNPTDTGWGVILIAALPEPSTVFLVALGLVAIAYRYRRREKASNRVS